MDSRICQTPAASPAEPGGLSLEARNSTRGQGYTPPEVGRTFARARELCQSIGEMPHMFPILLGLWIYYIMRAEYEASAELAEQMLSLGHQTDDPPGILLGNLVSSGTALFMGDLNTTLKHAEAALASYRRSEEALLRDLHLVQEPGAQIGRRQHYGFLGFLIRDLQEHNLPLNWQENCIIRSR
jgi:hypothetical protein